MKIPFRINKLHHRIEITPDQMLIVINNEGSLIRVSRKDTKGESLVLLKSVDSVFLRVQREALREVLAGTLAFEDFPELPIEEKEDLRLMFEAIGEILEERRQA